MRLGKQVELMKEPKKEWQNLIDEYNNRIQIFIKSHTHKDNNGSKK